ncbi:hypothetical protein FKM82_007154 [Ascaphus truei]
MCIDPCYLNLKQIAPNIHCIFSVLFRTPLKSHISRVLNGRWKKNTVCSFTLKIRFRMNICLVVFTKGIGRRRQKHVWGYRKQLEL